MILTPEELAEHIAEKITDKMALIHRSVEAFVKLETGRNFELQAHTEFLDILPRQRTIRLRDFPVSLTSFEYVTARSSVDGSPSLEAFLPNCYVVEARKGLIKSLDDPFPEGVHSVKVVYDAGYSADDIKSEATEELSLVKTLIGDIFLREWRLSAGKKRHLQSRNIADETITYRTNLTGTEERVIGLLREGALL